MIDYTLPLDQLPDPLPIEPLNKPFDVTITPPGSKSITCRAYVLAALAKGESKLIRPLRADDTDLLLKALCTLGAEARWEGDDVYIKGVNGRFPRGGSVDLGDGGTPTRFMIACACLAAEPVVVDGSKRMRERPIAEGVEMLRQLGAKIEYVEAEGRLPVRVTPSESFVGGEIEVGQTQSSQFISALMLIAPVLSSGLRIRFKAAVTSRSYVDLTQLTMVRFGLRPTAIVDDERAIEELQIPPMAVVTHEFHVTPDASSAVYWALAAAAVRGSTIRLPRLGFPLADRPDAPRATQMPQPDLGAILMLMRGGETFADDEDVLRLSAFQISDPVQLNCSSMPDGAVAIAAFTALLKQTSKLTGLRTLRVKETDRITALANELRKVGCEVATGEDWIEITPPQKAPQSPPLVAGAGSEPIIIETYNDHRMAMAFAVLGLAAPGGRRLAIRNPACVAKSYPTFWKDFAKLYQ